MYTAVKQVFSGIKAGNVGGTRKQCKYSISSCNTWREMLTLDTVTVVEYRLRFVLKPISTMKSVRIILIFLVLLVPITAELHCVDLTAMAAGELKRERDMSFENLFKTSNKATYVIRPNGCGQEQPLFTVINVTQSAEYRIFYIGEQLNRAETSGTRDVWTLNTTGGPLIYQRNTPVLNLIVRLPNNSRITFQIEDDQKQDKLSGNASSASPFSVLISSDFSRWGGITNYTFTLEEDSGKSNRTEYQVRAYIILCALKRENEYQYENCRNNVVSGQFQCFCRRTPNFVPAISLVTVVVVAASIVLFTAWGRKKVPKQIGNEQVLWILCSPRTVQYQYDLCFRIGCATNNFDFEKTMIDFDFITPDNRIMAQGRIKAHLLSPEEVSEVHFIMNRLTVLSHNSFASISFKHIGGNPQSKIFFYGMTITDCISSERYSFPVKKYIRSTTVKHRLGADEAKGSEMPIPPLPPLTNSEIIVFNTFIIFVNACIGTAVTNSENSLQAWHRIGELAVISCATGLSLVLMTICYRLLVKHEEIRHRLILDDSVSVWKIVELAILLLLCATIGAIMVYMAYSGSSFTASHTRAWTSVWFVMSAVTTLCFLLADKLELAEFFFYFCSRSSRLEREMDMQNQSVKEQESLGGKSSVSGSSPPSPSASVPKLEPDVQVDAETENLVTKFAMQKEAEDKLKVAKGKHKIVLPKAIK